MGLAALRKFELQAETGSGGSKREYLKIARLGGTYNSLGER